MFLNYNEQGRYSGEDTFPIADFNCMPQVSSLEFHPVASCDYHQSQTFVHAGNLKREFIWYKRMRAAGGIMISYDDLNS